MASAFSNQTTTQFANHLETVWRPRLSLDTSEMMEIANNFEDAEVEKIANSLVIRKVLPKTTNKVAGTVALDAGGMTFEQETETAATMTPQFGYCALAVNQQSQVRMLNKPAYSAAVREQFLRSLPEQIDNDAGGLMDDLATNVVGSSATNISKDLILQAAGILRGAAKRYYRPGKDLAYLRIAPTQMRYLYNIDAITNANLRGDGDNPNVTGVLVEAWGIDLGISGNIVSSGSAFHNPLHVRQAFALGYNAKPQMAPPQNNGLAALLMGFAEWGVVEVYDSFAVDLQTSTG